MVRGQIYYDLVKNKRQGQRIVHKKLLYLGTLSGLDMAGRAMLVMRLETLLMYRYDSALEDTAIESLAVSIVGKLYSRQSGHSEAGEEIWASGGEMGEILDERISLGSLRQVRVREMGASWTCWQAIEHLGIRKFLTGQSGWSEADAEVLLMNLMGRLVCPVSERKTGLWLKEESGGPDLLDSAVSLSLDDLYKSGRKLLGVKAALEDHLYEKLDSELSFGGARMMYDMTNTYFEGRMLGSSLAQYGRSKERRTDCPIVSIGLLCNESGFIRRSYFHAGNVSEPGTLAEVLNEVGQSAGILTDAGIGTAENIKAMALRGIPYMCVVREGFAHYQEDFASAAQIEHETSNGQHYKVWVQLHGHNFEAGGRTFKDQLIFVKSEAKQAKEDGIFSLQKNRMETGLHQIRESLAKSRGHKEIGQVSQRIGRLRERHSRISPAFDIRLQDDGTNVTALNWTYDASREQRNGTYIIRTSLPVTSAAEGWRMYHTLSTIEAVNRCCKTDLKMRPVYHQKDESIQAHLFLTLLACTIVTYIRNLLDKRGICWSWQEIVRIMNTQKVILSEFKNKQGQLFLLSKWSEPEYKAAQIYQALGYSAHRSPGFFFKVSPDDA